MSVGPELTVASATLATARGWKRRPLQIQRIAQNWNRDERICRIRSVRGIAQPAMRPISTFETPSCWIGPRGLDGSALPSRLARKLLVLLIADKSNLYCM